MDHQVCFGFIDPTVLYNLSEQHIQLFLSFILLTTMAAGILAAIRIYGKAFFFMTAIWNLINLGIAFWLYQHIQESSPLNSYWLYDHLILVFGINLGLDIFYIVAATILLRKSRLKERYTNMLKGFAYAIIIQGSGMFLIDLTTIIRIAFH